MANEQLSFPPVPDQPPVPDGPRIADKALNEVWQKQRAQAVPESTAQSNLSSARQNANAARRTAEHNELTNRQILDSHHPKV